MTTEKNNKSNYVLATGDSAASRLSLLNEIFGPGTKHLLTEAGLSEQMQVAEIGCGTGLVALQMAAVVGEGGKVAAVDSSREQLQVAGRNAAVAGASNISFYLADAYDTGLPYTSYDLVYSRFLMCHLVEPLKALVEMRALLKPGGILVCEDHDDGGISTEPPTLTYKRLVEISHALNCSRGLDSCIGLKLPRLLQDAGFSKPEVRVNQIASLRGKHKSFWEMTLREAEASILAAGASTHEELEYIYADMRRIANDESILLMLARVTQVCARK